MADYIISCHGTYEYDFPLSHSLVGVSELVIFKNHAGTLRIEKSERIFRDLLNGKDQGLESEIWTRMAPGRCYPSITLRGASEFASGIFKVGSGGAFPIRKYHTQWVGSLHDELKYLTSINAKTVYLLTCTAVVSMIDPAKINHYFDNKVELVGDEFKKHEQVVV